MPRNFSKYQYETSPRKLEPEYTPATKKMQPKKTTIKKSTIQKNKSQKKLENKRKVKTVMYILIGFAILFAITYRNSQIDEDFAKVQDLKSQLASLEKQNTQLEIAIENDLNLNNLQQEAKSKLGMQKLTTKQTMYVSLPKTDYIESGTEEIIKKEKTPIYESIINSVMNIFK